MQNRTQSESAATPWAMMLLAAANGMAIVAVIVLSILMLTSTPIYAQESSVSIELKDIEDDLKDAALDIEEALADIGLDDRIEISFDDEEDDRPRLGVYLDNLDFEDAYKLRYPYCHGVYVDGTTSNGNAQRAGLIEGDVIMYFDGKKVLYEDHLIRLISSKRFGDTVKVVYFRDEALDSTMVTFAAPVKKTELKADMDMGQAEDDSGKRRKRNSVGDGGGGYTPYLVDGDFSDIADLMTELGLQNSPFAGKEAGIFLHGGGGKGNVGNGWFLGGFGAGGGIQKSVNMDSLSRKINFNMGFGAFTIDKRVAPFEWLTLGAGVGLGGATYRVNVLQVGDAFTWGNIGDELIDNGNNAITITKKYAIVQPRVEAMLRLTDWMRLRAEYGYLYGYSFDTGWNTIVDAEDYEWGRETFELADSPDTKLEAPTISVGLWFGF